jgi:hypothetical protein
MTEERRHEFTHGLYGWITHTDLASRTFQPPLSTEQGEYHLFAYSDAGGGGIRGTVDAEPPGSTPSVHVRDTHATYEAALAAGAEPVRPPTKVMEGVCVAAVRAPGGVVIGFSGPT